MTNIWAPKQCQMKKNSQLQGFWSCGALQIRYKVCLHPTSYREFKNYMHNYCMATSTNGSIEAVILKQTV